MCDAPPRRAEPPVRVYGWGCVRDSLPCRACEKHMRAAIRSRVHWELRIADGWMLRVQDCLPVNKELFTHWHPRCSLQARFRVHSVSPDVVETEVLEVRLHDHHQYEAEGAHNHRQT